jgi:serine/threonine protein kinase
MAPEINLRKPYSGASVDLFACGIILFIMTTQHPPFTKAIPDDPYYKLICLNKEDIFWKAHARNKPNGEAFFSENFKDLINQMLQYEPEKRLTIEQIANHPWYTDSKCATLEEIQAEFASRKLLIDAENETKRLQKEQERNKKKEELMKLKQQLKAPISKKPYVKTRGEGEAEDNQEEEKNEVEYERVLEDYVRLIAKQTELFSTFDADTLLEELIKLSETMALSHEVAKDKYKIKMEFMVGEGKKASHLTMTAKILKVDEERVCIDFQKSEGDVFTFHKQFKTINEYLGELIDAAY